MLLTILVILFVGVPFLKALLKVLAKFGRDLW